MDVTGTLTVGNYGTGVIPQAAIDGGIGLVDTNFTDTDVNVDKRLYVKLRSDSLHRAMHHVSYLISVPTNSGGMG